MSIEMDLEFQDVPITVTFEYYPHTPSTLNEPGNTRRFILQGVYVGGVEISKLMDEYIWCEISDRIEEIVKEDNEDMMI